MGGVYILNQIFDRESDRINKKLFLLSLGIFPFWLAVTELIICWTIGFYLASKLAYPFLPVFGVAGALGILYTTPPGKLKGRPILDLLANTIGYGILTFILGSIVVETYNPVFIIWSLPYAFAVAGVFVNTTIVDMDGDIKAGERTTAILLGPQLSRILALSLVILALLAAIINLDRLAIFAIIPSIVVFILALLRAERKYDVLSFRLPPFFLAVAAGIVYPPYLLFLALVLLAMRIYYNKRFGITFPSPVEG